MPIRALTEADAERYWNLRLRALREHPDAFGTSYHEQADLPLEETVQRFRQEMSSPENFVLGAFDDDGQLVGMVGLRRERGAKERHKAGIWGMYVAPEARGRGVGKSLLAEVIVRARALPGLEQVHLSVVTRMAAARRLYQSFGFEVYGVEPRALKLNDTYLDEEHRVLRLA